MTKTVLSDETGFIIPAEMVIFLAVLTCVSVVGWAISRDTMDIHVMPQGKVAVGQVPADVAASNSDSSFSFRTDLPVSSDCKVIEVVGLQTEKAASKETAE